MTILDDAVEDIWKTAEEKGIGLEKIKYTGQNREGTEYNLRCVADSDTFDFVKQVFDRYNIETRNAHMNDEDEFEIIIDPSTSS